MKIISLRIVNDDLVKIQNLRLLCQSSNLSSMRSYLVLVTNINFINDASWVVLLNHSTVVNGMALSQTWIQKSPKEALSNEMEFAIIFAD